MNHTHCLNETTASQLVLGVLPSELATESEQHLLECQSCLQLVEGQVANDGLMSVLQDSASEESSVADEQLDAEVDALVKDLDCLAGPANANANAFAEIEALMVPTNSNDELGKFAHFRILEILGAGGMGVVLKAVDERISRTVALKLMRPSLTANKDARLRFRREAMAVAAFEHENIVTVYDVDEHNDTPYFAMEWLEGESLRDRLARTEKISVEEALRITREVAVGLATAHDRGQLHRDIKPDNLWLRNPGGQVKILDFGLVHSVDSSASLTHSGAILGTPEYMAPEQACGENIDGRCDLFSLGCVLYHMLTGSPPFQGKNVVATLVAISNAVVKPPSEVDSSIPQAVSDVAMKLLQRDAEQRFDSAVTLTEEIKKIEACRFDSRRATSRLAKRVWLWPLLIAAGVAAVFAGIIAVKTDKGTIYIDTGTSKEVVALVEGEAVELRDKATNRTFKLSVGASPIRSGEYEIVATEAGGKLAFSSREFAIGRGDHEHIRVWLEGSQYEPLGDGSGKEAIQLRNHKVQKILRALRENKATQASTVARLQKLVKTLAKNLDVAVDENGQITSTASVAMQKMIDSIAATEFEIADLEAAIKTQEEQIENGDFRLDLLAANSLPGIQAMQSELAAKKAAKKAALSKIEASTTDGKDSSAYLRTLSELEKLQVRIPIEIDRVKEKAANEYAAYQLYEKRTQLSQKTNLRDQLAEQYDELKYKLQKEGNTRLELQFASEELQRALALFAKISERESKLSMTFGLSQDLADEMWEDKEESNPKDP